MTISLPLDVSPADETARQREERQDKRIAEADEQYYAGRRNAGGAKLGTKNFLNADSLVDKPTIRLKVPFGRLGEKIVAPTRALGYRISMFSFSRVFFFLANYAKAFALSSVSGLCHTSLQF